MKTHLTRRGFSAALACGLAAPALIGRPTHAAAGARFQLDWKFNAQFAGLFVAQDAGLYGAGLDIRPWADGINAISEVAEGRADFGCAEQNLIIGAQAEGAPVKAVATMFQASPYGLMAPAGAGLGSLEDLRGKRVGVHVDGIKVMDLVKGVAGIDDIEVIEIPYADKFDRTVSGEFAAVQCYVIDEPIGVEAAHGAAPEVLELRKFGLQSTAQTIVAHDRLIAEDPAAVSAVLDATFEGWRRALADKPATAALVVERFVPEGSPYKDVVYQTRTLELLAPYVTGDGDDVIGMIDAERWETAARLMADYGIVPGLPDMAASLARGLFPAG